MIARSEFQIQILRYRRKITALIIPCITTILLYVTPPKYKKRRKKRKSNLSILKLPDYTIYFTNHYCTFNFVYNVLRYKEIQYSIQSMKYFLFKFISNSNNFAMIPNFFFLNNKKETEKLVVNTNIARLQNCYYIHSPFTNQDWDRVYIYGTC